MAVKGDGVRELQALLKETKTQGWLALLFNQNVWIVGKMLEKEMLLVPMEEENKRFDGFNFIGKKKLLENDLG